MTHAAARNASALAAGLLFGLGLAISQMVNPRKVLDFLDVAGNWDPSLVLVLGGAVGVAMLAFRFVLKRRQPIFDGEFHLPKTTKVDRRLLVGSAIFGVGWGIGGYCPGPGIAALSAASVEALVFVAGLAFGSFLYQRFAAPRD
ncbi:MAG: YeeE/YedE family protein [Betaproteobacteria bacterium]|nr:MAG: YeeE/YedE family protein [Betaproteobacteria bacterium]TMG77904.1 MAG: YeeE/YedE family protein [Betaproteobacteria bacterium]